MVKEKKIIEGSSEIVVYPGEVKKSDDVFYNPSMKFNRDLSVLALKAFFHKYDKKKMVVVDGLSASGIRGVRYAKECDCVSEVVFNDLNPEAVKLIRKNVKLNSVENFEIFSKELNELLYSFRNKIDFVDIDPFGSPVYFLDSAAVALYNNSMLGVTATDTAALSGSSSRACLRKYDSKPLKVDMMHEIGLRILIGSIVRRLAVYEKGFFPLISFSKLHYYRVCGRALNGTLQSDKALKSIGFMVYCQKCGYRKLSLERLGVCCECGSGLSYAGPLWIGILGDSSFVSKMKSYCKDEDELKFLDVLLNEYKINSPMVDIHVFSKLNKIDFGRTKDIMDRLSGLGFCVSRTHISPTAIRTDADFGTLKKVMKKK